MTRSGLAGRLHLVLVPGFGGFDVLGDLEYYVGTTGLFRDWWEKRRGSEGGGEPVLHYFDNFPTAGVRTRAALLREFLAKRLARNQIQEAHDAVVLIGHSTGGLDIRQLICDLTGSVPDAQPEGARPDARVAVDGSRESAVKLENARLRALIQRVVFLSVPQRGTNIANWVGKHDGARKWLTSWLRAAVDLSDIPGLEGADVWWSKHVTRPRLDAAERQMALSVAVSDVRLEMAERLDDEPLRAARGRAAQASVNLWLSHIQGDFLAIRDLAYGVATDPTPARFSPEQRRAELSGYQASPGKWDALEVRSYATLGRCPFGAAWQRERTRVEPGGVAHLFDVVKDAFDKSLWDGKSDLAYRIAYRICAEGPFAAEPGASMQLLDGRESVPLEAWQNDGIVNTASMAWPLGDTFLVHADHGDIIGHCALVPVADPAEAGQGRKYHTYDILESGSALHGVEFSPEQFAEVWQHIFEFAVLGS